MVAPTPYDTKVWHFSHILGWPERRIATEVGISPTSVHRILARLRAEPPTEEELQAFVAPPTPPNGLPVLSALSSARRGGGPVLTLAAAWGILLVALAIAFVLAAAAITILFPQHGPAGPPGPPGSGDVIVCARYDHGVITGLEAPGADGTCGAGTLIRLHTQ